LALGARRVLVLALAAAVLLAAAAHVAYAQKRIANSPYVVYLTTANPREVKTSFEQGETLYIRLSNTDPNDHKVSFTLEIIDPENRVVNTYSAAGILIPGNGQRLIYQWQIPESAPTGRWTITIRLADDTGATYTDSIYFTVTSPAPMVPPVTQRQQVQQGGIPLALVIGVAIAIVVIAIAAILVAMRGKKKAQEEYAPPGGAPVPGAATTPTTPVGPVTGPVPPPPVSPPAGEETTVVPGAAPAAPSQPPASGETVITLAKLVAPNGKVIPIVGTRQAFGREDFQDLVPPESLRLISRRSKPQFEIFFDPNTKQFYIVDNNSANGTYLNGVNIRGKGPQPLKNGDKISPAGVIELTFQA